MPNYGVAQAGGVLTELQPGDSYALWNAETPAAGTPSVAFATGYNPGGGGSKPITFQILFAAAPTDSLVIQASNQDIDATYETVYTSTNLQYDAYADLGGYAFYRAKLVSQSAGGAVSVIVKR